MPDAPAADDDPDDPDHSGLVFLRVPADPRYARVVRIAVSAFAVRLHLPPATVEDLRLAVDEALVLLLGADSGPDAHVVVSLDAEGGRLPVLLRLQLDPEPGAADDPGALSRFRELVPPAVAVDRVDRAAGRVELRLPA